MTEDNTILLAHVTHGKSPQWRIRVGKVSLWRVVAESAWMTTLHWIGICCNRHIWRFIPGASYLGFKLLNLSNSWENSYVNEVFETEVGDGWVRANFPDFWKDMHEAFDDNAPLE